MESPAADFWKEVLDGDQWEIAGRSLPTIISRSEAMKKVGREVASVARASSTVLLYGESGVGKDLIARAIHALSPRASKNYVALNCAAVTESLFESELFGHERGAFTGADRQKIGMWEEADAGTLFLDEIGDMPVTVQAKVLRAIENKTIRRVGGVKELPMDARIVAATNMDLRRMVKEGRFRKDLYYRVNVVGITVPPLRQRKDDIPLLFNYFLRTIAEKMGRGVPAVHANVIEELPRRTWVGNIRELQNIVEHALATTWGIDELVMEHFGISPEERDYGGTKLSDMVAEFEADVIRRTLFHANGNQLEAAQRLGIHRNSLTNKINQYRLRDLYPELFHYWRRK